VFPVLGESKGRSAWLIDLFGWRTAENKKTTHQEFDELF
jgi:hypothetical protein